MNYLCESFKKNKLCEDRKDGEKWIGCMMCEHSFHVHCLLSYATQTQLERESKKQKTKQTDVFVQYWQIEKEKDELKIWKK